MEKMINNGDLQAIAVSKPKTRTKVPADDSEAANEGGEGEDESTDVDLDFKETGLDQLSGSGDDGERINIPGAGLKKVNQHAAIQKRPAYNNNHSFLGNTTLEFYHLR